MSKKNKQRIRLIIVNLFFILVCFGVLIPILYAFSVSLNAENSLLGANFSFLPKRMTLQNYKAVFTEKPILLWFRNSMILAGTTLVISLGTGIPAAYAFSNSNPKKLYVQNFQSQSSMHVPPVKVYPERRKIPTVAPRFFV